MNRRGFLRSIGLGIGGIALEQAIPLGRVWSFPKKIVLPQYQYMELLHVPLNRWEDFGAMLLPNDKVRLYGGARGGGKVAVIKSVDHARRLITLDYPA
jgi:hypothetical protein